MSIDYSFCMDTSASRQEVRDTLVKANIGLEKSLDYDDMSTAVSVATSVSVLGHPSSRSGRPDNGVVPKIRVSFHFRQKAGDPKYWVEYDTHIVRGIVVLLKAFPGADAYADALDGEFPMLLRRDGRLVLSEEMTDKDRFWDPAREPSYVAMVDLPYTIAPLGRQWNYFP